MTQTETSKRKLLLIDGNGLAYRAFYAVPPVLTAGGTPTNAVAGFFDMVIRLLAKENPTHVAVAFDKGVPTERVLEYQDFNAHRVEMPEDLAAQLPTIEDIVRGLGIQVFRVRGHQGDDCLGTLAKKASDEGMEVLILSGDLDLLQLVGPRVRVMTFRRGISDVVVYDEESVKKKFNLIPSQLADLRALAGDSSENITGVPGIGEVTAKKLLSQHGSLAGLFNSLEQLPAKWRNPLSENREEALDFLTRAAIRTDLGIIVDWDRAVYRGVALSRARDIFRRLELEELFVSLVASEKLPIHEPAAAPDTEVLVGRKGRTALSNLVKKSKDPIDILILGSGDELVGVVLACGEEQPKLVPFIGHEEAMTAEEAIKVLKPALKDKTRRKNIHNLRAFLMLDLSEGVSPDCNFFDVAIASHLIDSVEGNPWFDEICRRHAIEIPGEGSLMGRGIGSRKLSAVPLDELSRWAGARVLGLRALSHILEQRLGEEALLEQFLEVEMPLAWIFAQMEKSGVALDSSKLAEFETRLAQRIQEAEREVHDLANGSFDLDDPKELAEVIFDKMGVQVPARPKNGAPVGNDVIAQVAALHPIGSRIRDYRILSDLQRSFATALPLISEPRYGWFHRLAQHPVASSERLLWMGPTAVGGAVATFNRLLSEIETLANSDLRTEFENLLLSALVPRNSDRVLLGVSYSQLPLRLVAHLSQEPDLVTGVQRGEDVEQILLQAFSEEHQDTQVQRDSLDAVLGSIGAYRFAQSQGLAVAEAAEQLRLSRLRLSERYPNLHSFFEGQLEKARDQGWVSSIRGRRRNLPEFTSRNSDIRSTAERVARSASVHASAADLMKVALVEIGKLIWSAHLPATFSLQLRDELVLEIESKHLDKVLQAVEKVMQTQAQLSVPCTVRARSGKDLSRAEDLALVAATV